MAQRAKKSIFLAQRAKQTSAKVRSPPQELKEGPRSGPYLLVWLILRKYVVDMRQSAVEVNYITMHKQTIEGYTSAVCCITEPYKKYGLVENNAGHDSDT